MNELRKRICVFLTCESASTDVSDHTLIRLVGPECLFGNRQSVDLPVRLLKWESVSTYCRCGILKRHPPQKSINSNNHKGPYHLGVKMFLKVVRTTWARVYPAYVRIAKMACAPKLPSSICPIWWDGNEKTQSSGETLLADGMRWDDQWEEASRERFDCPAVVWHWRTSQHSQDLGAVYESRIRWESLWSALPELPGQLFLQTSQYSRSAVPPPTDRWSRWQICCCWKQPVKEQRQERKKEEMDR